MNETPFSEQTAPRNQRTQSTFADILVLMKSFCLRFSDCYDWVLPFVALVAAWRAQKTSSQVGRAWWGQNESLHVPLCTCGDDNELEDDSDDVDEPTDEGVSRVLHSVPSLPTLVLGPTTPARVRMELTVMGLTMTMIMDWHLKIYLELGKAAISSTKYWPQLVGGNPSYITWNTSLKLFSELEAKTGVRWRTSLQLKPQDGFWKNPVLSILGAGWPCITNHFLCQHSFKIHFKTENHNFQLSTKYLKEPINLCCIFRD